ncbi:MAG: PilZ domain-containing protein, partial [Planctomycetota bacterium]
MASVLVVDDGELQDVRALLQEFGTEFVHLQGEDIPEEIEDPKTLLVTTARRAVCLRYRSRGLQPRPPVRIAVCTGSSKTQRSILKRAGFDYLVRRPVHAAALRLLLLRALYHGKEKRHSTRFAFGQLVSFRTTFRRRKAMLAEISAYGARLLTRHHLTPGTQVLIQLPREVVGGRPLELRCCVVRVEQGDREHSAEGELSVGLRFDSLDDDAKGRLRTLLVELYWGPVMLPNAATGPEGSPIRPGVAGPIEPGTERRTDA